MKKTKEDLSEKLSLLEPDKNAILIYKEIETKSVDRLREFLGDLNGGKYNKEALQILRAVGNLRRTLKSQATMRVQVFRDVSKDKKELKLYLKTTMPHLLRKK